jgi:hypothetical protein
MSCFREAVIFYEIPALEFAVKQLRVHTETCHHEVAMTTHNVDHKHQILV